MITSSDILHASILVVDDKPANVLLLERMLRSAGYDRVSSTSQPQEVCALHLEHDYDIILLDLEMPGMDGFQVMENLKQIEKSGYLPVLVLTAQPSHRLRALKDGAKDFVSKPFDLAEVLLRVRNLLEVRLLHRQVQALNTQLMTKQAMAERLLAGLLHEPSLRLVRAASDAEATTPGADPARPRFAPSYVELVLLFADVAGFTRFAQTADAGAMQAVLEELASHDESSGGTNSARDTRTEDAAWLATDGLSTQDAADAVAAAHKALDLARSLDAFNAKSPYKLRVRVGLLPTEPGSPGEATRSFKL